MRDWIAQVLKSPQLSKSLSENGRQVILEKHTCDHRAQELEDIVSSIETPNKKNKPYELSDWKSYGL